MRKGRLSKLEGRWKHELELSQPLSAPFVAIRQAYFREGASEPDSTTVNPVAPIGEDIEELRQGLLQMMARALEEPVLDGEPSICGLKTRTEATCRTKEDRLHPAVIL